MDRISKDQEESKSLDIETLDFVTPFIASGKDDEYMRCDILSHNRCKVALDIERPTKQVIVVRDDLNMRKGKMGAQVGHAVSGFLHEIIDTGRLYTHAEHQWCTQDRRKKVILAVNSEADLLEIVQESQNAGITTHLVTDSGLTEFHGVPTRTCVAIGPDYSDKMESFLGKESPMWVSGRLRLY
jgi:PTH2 family peptidyl-tRNA hydrolase